MDMKLYTYKRKSVFMLLLLVGILFSMYSCQYETVPVGTIVPVGNYVPLGIASTTKAN